MDKSKENTLAALKMKFSMKDFFSKCNQIRKKLRIWSHLLKKSLMGNFIFWAVTYMYAYVYMHTYTDIQTYINTDLHIHINTLCVTQVR